MVGPWTILSTVGRTKILSKWSKISPSQEDSSWTALEIKIVMWLQPQVRGKVVIDSVFTYKKYVSYGCLTLRRCVQLSTSGADLCPTIVLLHRHHLRSLLHDRYCIVDVVLDWSQGGKKPCHNDVNFRAPETPIKSSTSIHVKWQLQRWSFPFFRPSSQPSFYTSVQLAPHKFTGCCLNLGGSQGCL